MFCNYENNITKTGIFLFLEQMRSLVTSPVFLMKKKLFNFLNWVMPRTFIPLYTMVSAMNVQDVIG